MNKILIERANISKITEKLFLSGSILDYNLLNELGITAVINVKSEQHDDIYELTSREIAYFWIPISDHNSPRLEQIDTCMRIINKYDKILLHCSVGRGRSAMLVACWILKENKFSTVEECISFITNIRPTISLTNNQYNKLCNYFKRLNNA